MKKETISVEYAKKLGVPENEVAGHGVGETALWIGSWNKNPHGRFIGTAYTMFAVVWENLTGTSGKVVYYHSGLSKGYYLVN